MDLFGEYNAIVHCNLATLFLCMVKEMTWNEQGYILVLGVMPGNSTHYHSRILVYIFCKSTYQQHFGQRKYFHVFRQRAHMLC